MNCTVKSQRRVNKSFKRAKRVHKSRSTDKIRNWSEKSQRRDEKNALHTAKTKTVYSDVISTLTQKGHLVADIKVKRNKTKKIL